MIPDPSTAGTPVGEDGPGGPAGNEPPVRSRSGHHCSGCGQPLEADVWDMTVFATQTTVAYLPCLWAAT